MSVLANQLPRLTLGLKAWTQTCANEGCSAKSMLHTLSRRKQGILFYGKWYCGPSCFETALQACISTLFSIQQDRPAQYRARMPLGLLMLSRGHITHAQLKTALALQQRSGGRIGEILRKLDFATEAQVTSAVAAQCGYPVLSLKDRQPNTSFRIPLEIVRSYSVLPIHFVESSRRLLLGVADSIDHGVLTLIDKMLSCTAAPCFITPSDFARALNEIPPSWHGKQVAFDRVRSPSDIARTIKSYAIQAGANEAKLGRSRDHLWVRLWNSRADFDILFRL